MSGFAIGSTVVSGMAIGSTIVYKAGPSTPGTIGDLTATVRLGVPVVVSTRVLGSGPLTWQLTPEWRQGAGDIYTDYANAVATTSWDGTTAELIGPRDVNSGLLEVRLDNRPAVVVDTYSAAREDGVVLYRTPELADGRHTLTVTVLGRKNVSSSGTYVGVASIIPRSTGLTQPPPPTTSPDDPVVPGSRSMYDWPFAADSIWNTPIGDGAIYGPSDLAPTTGAVWNGIPRVTKDVIFRFQSTADPLKDLTIGGNARGQVRVPPGHAHDGSYNGIFGYLRADNRHVKEGQPLLLVAGGNPSADYEYRGPFSLADSELDLQGPGDIGMHGAAHLPGTGGVLTLKELRSTEPIRHALAINVYAKRFLAYVNRSDKPGGGGLGWHWPARSADRYASTGYGGTNRDMVMGTLLAIPPAAFANLSLTHERSRRIAEALRDYGGYIVDDTFRDVHALSVETGFSEWNDVTFHKELMAVFTALRVVLNNSPSAKGGPGVRLAPTAPPFVEA